MRLLADFHGCAIGAFVNGIENLSDFQSKTGKNIATVLSYVHWFDPFPVQEAEMVYANGSVPLITWEPWVTHETGALEAIASGVYDDYVRQFLQAAKDLGKPVFLRFAHEMNGNWYPWDGFHNGASSSAEKYKKAWLYIYNVREELGADNVNLVWSVNNNNLPGDAWNTIKAYYPGDQYVDWVSMDGYNWGYSSWESFASVFDNVYQTLTDLTQKPLMIGEFSSAENGGSKADWITNALSGMEAGYPRVKIFCWFNINKERDWRVDSSSTSEAAFKQALQDSYFLDTIL